MTTELVTIEQIESMKPKKAIEILSDYGNIIHIIEDVKSQALSHVPDVSTDKGRKDIGSVANKVSRSKTFLVTCCDNAVKEYKDKIAKVNSTKKSITEQLDEARDTVLLPRKLWQEEQDKKEEARKAEINERIGNIRKLGQYLETDGKEACSSKVEALEAMDVSTGFDEFTQEAVTEIKEAIKSLNDRIIFLVQDEQRQKQENELLEIRQKQEIEQRLNNLQMIPLNLMGKNSSEIENKISSLQDFEISEHEFKERVNEAREKVQVVISQLQVMAEQAKQLESIAPSPTKAESKPVQEVVQHSTVQPSRLDQARQVMQQAETAPVASVERAERSDEMISLSVKEYNELMRKAELVDALYAVGVENWDGYIDAMAMVSAV